MLARASFVAAALAAVFTVLAALHVFWAFGGSAAGSAAIPEVAGRPAFVPSRLATLAVAAALMLAALVALAQGGWLALDRWLVPAWVARAACGVLGAVFVLRAIGEFRLVGFFKSVRGTAFARWDTLLFSPLCLVLGVAALWLVFSGRPSPKG